VEGEGRGRNPRTPLLCFQARRLESGAGIAMGPPPLRSQAIGLTWLTLVDGGGSPGRGSPASGARGRWPWPASALDQSPARHHPPGLQSVDRRPVQPRLSWRSPLANRYPRNHPNRPEPGSRSRRLLRRSTASRCNRLSPGCPAGAGAAPRSAAAAPGGAVVRRCSR